MSDFPNIITTNIIRSDYDAFWQDISSEMQVASPQPTTIISAPFNAGSSEEIQLQKMMLACKLQPDQYQVVQLAAGDVRSWPRLREALKPEQVVLLGIHPGQLGIAARLHLFAPNRFDDCTWIISPSLAELEKDTEAKKQLWLQGLKPVFIGSQTNS